MSLVTIPSSEQAADPSRRQFCAHACQAASLAAIGALLPACGGGGGNPTSPGTVNAGDTPLAVLSGTVSGRTVSVPVVAGGPLAAVGGVALVANGLGSFLVARTSQTTFSVLTAVCTHEGNTVNLFNGELFVCPVHNSKFTTAGAVANGPATQALRSFPAAFAAETLTFTA
jgi:Rieske Fe-S protein